jgi:hypothetical protein
MNTAFVEPESGTDVVVLPNLTPGYRRPATVLGVRRMEEIRGQ